MAFANGYNYRKQIDITGATGGSTGYQVPITVNSGSGTDAAGVAYLGGNATLFPLDIQFTAADGSTVLDYWRETNDDTKFWVEVAADLASNQTIYLYYGLADINQDLDTQSIGSVPYASNPVMTVGAGGAWDDFWVAAHSIVKSGSTYYLYYNGAPDDTGAYRIGLATSSDGITWSKSGSNPVVTVGSGGSWDDFAVVSPCVFIEGATWYMMYAGQQSGGAWKIGLATSSDGTTWTKDVGNPVMAGTAAEWDSGSVIPGTRMIKESSTYYMYYWGYTSGGDFATWKIGLATSTDLTTWSKSGSNPVLSGGDAGTWQRGVIEPCVFKINSTYIMLYQGQSTSQDYTNIGMATSTDKTTWTKKARRVIPRGATGSWNSNWAEAPTLAEDFSPYRVYYSGSQGSGATPRMEVGYAEIAADFSDGDSTFQFFDDFDDTSLDTSAKWTNTGTFTENDTNDNNLAKYAANTNTQYICVGKTDVAYPCVLESRAKTDGDDQYSWKYTLLWDSAWANSGYLAGYYEDAGNAYHKIFKFPGGTADQTNEADTENYRRLGLYINGTNQKFLVDGTQKGAIATTPPQASTKVTLATVRTTSTSDFTALFDWVFARKWTSSGTEPSVGTPGAEETPAAPSTPGLISSRGRIVNAGGFGGNTKGFLVNLGG